MALLLVMYIFLILSPLFLHLVHDFHVIKWRVQLAISVTAVLLVYNVFISVWKYVHFLRRVWNDILWCRHFSAVEDKNIGPLVKTIMTRCIHCTRCIRYSQFYKPDLPFIVKCQMSKTFIVGAVCREFESEAPAAEEMLDWVVCSSKQFCFQMCLECGDGGWTFSRWRQRVPDSWCSDTESLGLEIDPCRRLIV